MSDFKTFVALGMPAPLAKEVDKGIQNGGPNTVQKDGDASTTVVQAKGALVPREASIRAADDLYVNDFGLTGTAPGDTAAFIAANDTVAGESEAATVGIAPGTTVNGDGSADLFAANRVIVTGHGELTGFLRKQAHRPYLASPRMFPATVKARHLKRFHAACATGKATIVLMGDSIFSIGANLISTAESPLFALIDEIMKQNPKVEFDVYNYCIPGQTFSGMWSDSSMPPSWFDNPNDLSWKKFVTAVNPDLVIPFSGANENWSIDATSMQNLVAYLQDSENFTSGNVPDLVFGVTFQPSVGSPTLNYNTASEQDGITYALNYVRTYAISNGYGYMDFGRWYSIIRDGIDPCELALTRVDPTPGTTLTAWGEAMPVDSNNTWVFPAAKNEIGVSADHCTDNLVAIEVTENPQNMEIVLSAKNYTDTSSANHLFVLNNNGKIRVNYQDGVNSNVFDETTDVDWPTGASTWMLVKKDGRVRVQIQQPLSNGWNISGQDNVNNGMGMVTLWDHEVACFGAPYRPQIKFGAPVGVIVYNLCVGDSTLAQTSGNRSSGQRYRPIASDYELFVADTDHFGGSNAMHNNAYGVRIGMAPVIRAQEWGRPIIGFLSTGGIDCSGTITTAQFKAGGECYLNGVRVGSTAFGDPGPYIVNDGANGLKILVNGGGDSPSGTVEICALNKDGSNASRYSIGTFNIATGSFVASGPIGANGVTPAHQATITGSKPTDPATLQLLQACAASGFVKDATS